LTNFWGYDIMEFRLAWSVREPIKEGLLLSKLVWLFQFRSLGGNTRRIDTSYHLVRG